MSLARVGVRVTLPAALSVVGSTRRYLDQFVLALSANAAAASQVALAVHELFDNAIRHATGGVVELVVELEDASASFTSLTVQTLNQASEQDCSEVQRILDEMHGAHDPMEHFDREIRASVGRKSSGLGLVRVCTEANINLSCHCEKGYLSVTGTTTVTLGRVA